MMPLKRQEGSVFDIASEAENNGKARLEIRREARDGVLLAAIKDTIVSSHGAHLRFDAD